MSADADMIAACLELLHVLVSVRELIRIAVISLDLPIAML
jgi:hypothetical protein